MKKLLSQIISIHSVTEEEEKIANFIETKLNKIKGQTQRIKNNVLWTCPNFNPKKETIALIGHLDTVPYNKKQWKISHPLKMKVINGKLYGRGTTDMKAGIAIAMDIILKKKYNDKYNLIGIFYGGEETGIPNGITTLLKKNILPKIDLAIIHEPTDRKIVYGVLSCMDLEITTHGHSVHSSIAYTGKNAIYRMVDVILDIQNIPLQSIHGTRESVSVNIIQAGITHNIVPDIATAKLDFRFDPSISCYDLINKYFFI